MALRKALVRKTGSPGVAELPAADTLSPTWTGTATVPVGAIAAGLLTATATMTTTTGSGVLKNGTPVSIGVTGLPAGLQAMSGAVTADGVVTVFLRAATLISLAVAATLGVTATQPR